MRFEFYVLRYDWNTKKVIRWNIFNNIKIQECVEKEVKKYLRSPKNYCCEKYNRIGGQTYQAICGFEALCKEIDSILSWQMRSRREYEISVADAFETDVEKMEKWDCYGQCKENVEVIARECIYQYKKQKKGE